MAPLPRRQFLLGAAGLVAPTLTPALTPALVRAQAASARVVVVGGGFGGATVARYLRAWAPRVQVTLVEPAQQLVTCPFSNHYLAGLRTWDSISHDYDGLRAAGVRVIHARAEDVEALTEFDEGPLPADWVGELGKRGIDVVRDIERDAACAVLRMYGERGGANY